MIEKTQQQMFKEKLENCEKLPSEKCIYTSCGAYQITYCKSNKRTPKIERQRQSSKRRDLATMKHIFLELGSIPHETRKHWGRFGSWVSYNFALAIIDKEIARLDREANRVFLSRGGRKQ